MAETNQSVLDRLLNPETLDNAAKIWSVSQGNPYPNGVYNPGTGGGPYMAPGGGNTMWIVGGVVVALLLLWVFMSKKS